MAVEDALEGIGFEGSDASGEREVERGEGKIARHLTLADVLNFSLTAVETTSDVEESGR